MIASSEEAEQIHCEPTDLDVDMDGLDQVNDDSFLADESVEEQKGIVSTTEEEDNNLYDPAEITAVDDLLETEPEMETETEPTLEPTPAQPEVSGICLNLIFRKILTINDQSLVLSLRGVALDYQTVAMDSFK